MNIALFASSLSKQEVYQWEKLGVNKGYISNWISHHIDYNEAKQWIETEVISGNWGYNPF